MEIIPVNFGLKYRPAKLGVEYHIKDQPEAHFVHEIPLAFELHPFPAGRDLLNRGHHSQRSVHRDLDRPQSTNQQLRLTKRPLCQHRADKHEIYEEMCSSFADFAN